MDRYEVRTCEMGGYLADPSLHREQAMGNGASRSRRATAVRLRWRFRTRWLPARTSHAWHHRDRTRGRRRRKSRGSSARTRGCIRLDRTPFGPDPADRPVWAHRPTNAFDRPVAGHYTRHRPRRQVRPTAGPVSIPARSVARPLVGPGSRRCGLAHHDPAGGDLSDWLKSESARTSRSRLPCVASTRRSSRAASSPKPGDASTTRSPASSASARKRSARRSPAASSPAIGPPGGVASSPAPFIISLAGACPRPAHQEVSREPDGAAPGGHEDRHARR